MQLRVAWKHLHSPLHAFLHLQWISSWHTFAASNSVLHSGAQPSPIFCHPQSDGLGNSWIGAHACAQTWPALYAARFMCCYNAACVGGILSSPRLPCANSDCLWFGLRTIPPWIKHGLKWCLRVYSTQIQDPTTTHLHIRSLLVLAILKPEDNRIVALDRQLSSAASTSCWECCFFTAYMCVYMCVDLPST